jgi:hypothetical protein
VTRLVSVAVALVFPVLGIAVAACGSEEPPIRSVTYGMTMSQVRDSMGEPDNIERKAAGLECWTWGQSEDPPSGPNAGVCFQDRRVNLIVPSPPSS